VGTLGIVTEARLATEPLERGRTTVEVYFDTPEQAVGAAGRAVELGAAACEFLNRECIRIVREESPELGVPAAGSLLLIEFTGEGHGTAATRLARELGAGRSLAPRVSSDPAEQRELWNVRKRLLFTVKNPAPGREALSVVNDVGVPRERLPELVRFAERRFAARGLTAPIYGHAGSGNLHMRPVFDLTRPDTPRTVEAVAAEIYGEVTRLGGTITAEHGMGPLRVPYLSREWPPPLLEAMRSLKTLFDPAGILNPGAMLPDGPPPAYRFVASNRSFE
jgi:FAD/FMN-containing dehydrogenase